MDGIFNYHYLPTFTTKIKQMQVIYNIYGSYGLELIITNLDSEVESPSFLGIMIQSKWSNVREVPRYIVDLGGGFKFGAVFPSWPIFFKGVETTN